MYKWLIRPLLFKLNPEQAHHFTFSFLKLVMSFPLMGSVITKMFALKSPQLEREVMGIRFKNPVGLAAGFDKDARLFNELGAFGFGFIEVGTVTPEPQPGNPKPRMFRLPQDHALINRMGFNNNGAGQAARNLENKNPGIIIGVNIGKNKNTPVDDAISDYLKCFEILFPVADYFAVNVSSPNTPGLRSLQDKKPLLDLLNKVQELNYSKPSPKPVLLKIAPDLNEQQLDEILEIVQLTKIQGLIATNTTLNRSGLQTTQNITGEAGGLSGKPLKDKSTEVIRYLRERGGNNLVIIGAGGIFNAADAKEKLNAGADLIQVYTGFIYEGPSMIKRILKKIVLKP